jgi:hypothetical protein
MRERREIEREMFNAREDLERSVNELKHVIAEKAHVRARAHHAVDERVDRVKDAARRGIDRGKDAARRGIDRGRTMMYRTRDGAVVYYHKARDQAREHKLLLGVILGGITLLTLGAVLLGRRRHDRHWYSRC